VSKKIAPVVSCLQDPECKKYVHWRDLIEIIPDDKYKNSVPIVEEALDRLEVVIPKVLKDIVELPNKIPIEAITEYLFTRYPAVAELLPKNYKNQKVKLFLTDNIKDKKIKIATANPLFKEVRINLSEVSTYSAYTEDGEPLRSCQEIS